MGCGVVPRGLNVTLKGCLSFVWIAIEQSAIVSGIVDDVFMGFVVRDRSWAAELSNDGVVYLYPTYCAAIQLKDVFVCLHDTCEIIYQSDHAPMQKLWSEIPSGEATELWTALIVIR